MHYPHTPFVINISTYPTRALQTTIIGDCSSNRWLAAKNRTKAYVKPWGIDILLLIFARQLLILNYEKTPAMERDTGSAMVYSMMYML